MADSENINHEISVIGYRKRKRKQRQKVLIIVSQSKELQVLGLQGPTR